MSSDDVIGIPGWPGLYARRFVVEMWQAAGSPWINDAGRLFATQLEARLKFENGTGSPADDPRRPDKYPLAHTRFVALDVPPVYAPAMERAGFIRPFSYEPWHFTLPNVYRWPIVTSIPATADSGSTPFVPPSTATESERLPMPTFIAPNIIAWDNGVVNSYPQDIWDSMRYVAMINLENDAKDKPKTAPQYQVDTYKRESWAAFDFAKNETARATTIATIAALKAGDIISATVDEDAIAQAVLEKIKGIVTATPPTPVEPPKA